MIDSDGCLRGFLPSIQLYRFVEAYKKLIDGLEIMLLITLNRTPTTE
jgi:hypothetical protein